MRCVSYNAQISSPRVASHIADDISLSHSKVGINTTRGMRTSAAPPPCFDCKHNINPSHHIHDTSLQYSARNV